jgi:hypothetical protein
MSSIVADGKLEKAEALEALRLAAKTATESLLDALEKCDTDEQRRKIVRDRDEVLLAYLQSLSKSLVHTGGAFEQTARDLEATADEVAQKAKALKDAAEAIHLFADLVRLAASLALAFG